MLAESPNIAIGDNMSISVPTKCANPKCGMPSFKMIHHSSQKVEIDAVDGAPVFAHLVTYRCSQCGNTWAVRGYSPESRETPSSEQNVATLESRSGIRVW